MIFECADASFSGIAAMHSRRHQLVVNLGINQVIFEEGGTFVVESMESRCVASTEEAFVDMLEGCENAFGGAIFEWLGKNVIAVVVIEHHDVVIAMGGRNDEAASLVRVDLACFKEVGKTCMAALLNTFWELVGVGIGVENGIVGVGRNCGRGCCGAAEVLAALVHMSFGGGNGVWSILVE